LASRDGWKFKHSERKEMTTQLNVFRKLGIAIAAIGMFASSAGTSYANDCVKVEATDGYSYQWYTDRYGSDYSSFSIPSQCAPSATICLDLRENDCYTACHSDDACLAWTYLKPSSVHADAYCWLKNAAPNATYNSTTDTGTKFEYNTDRAGSDIGTVTTSTAAACSRACTSNDNCWAWTWARSTNVCWLKNSIPGTSSNTDTISGYQKWSCIIY
jgi:hypothetical protein